MDVKITWTCLPLAFALSCCEPIEQGPRDDQNPTSGGALRAGHFARTMVDNTSFFRQLPLTGAQADLLLQRHTSVRMIQLDPGYSKVELDSGEVGYVLTAMLEPMPAKLGADKPGDTTGGGTVDVPNPVPPGGPGMPEILPPTIDPE